MLALRARVPQFSAGFAAASRAVARLPVPSIEVVAE
jgi:hypothetical protein